MLCEAMGVVTMGCVCVKSKIWGGFLKHPRFRGPLEQLGNAVVFTVVYCLPCCPWSCVHCIKLPHPPP